VKKLTAIFLFSAFFFSVFGAETIEITRNEIAEVAQEYANDENIEANNELPLQTDETINEEQQQALRNSLFEQLAIQEAHYSERFFDNATLFSPNRILRQHFFGSDWFNWTDALRGNPNFVSVYNSPDFPINRALWRGYTIPMEYSLLNRLYSPTLPWEHYDLLEIREFGISPTGAISPTILDGRTITPDVFFAWQGGLFSGNMLNFRMMRNLSHNLSLSAFISHTDLKRTDFYRTGGIAPMFRTWYRDTTKTVIRGYNPLSYSNRSGFALDYQNNIRVNFRYSYSDLRFDLPYQTDSILAVDTTRQEGSRLPIAWNEARNFLNQIDGMLEIPIGDKFLLRNLGRLETVNQRETPLSRTRSGYFATPRSSQNHTVQAAGSQFFFAPVPNDSISIQFSVNRHISQAEDITHTVAHHTKIIAENKFTSPNSDNFSVITRGGAQFIRANASEIETNPLALAEIDWQIGNFSTQFWGRYDIAPLAFSTPFTYNYYYELGEGFWGFGANLRYQFPAASIHGGYSYMRLPIGSVGKFWHRDIPYFQPQNVFSAGGNLGEIGRFSLFTNWFLSDEMPHVKSSSGLRFRFNRDLQVRQFYVETFYNYWSPRSISIGSWLNFEDFTISYIGNYPHWYRAIHDVSLKFTAEVHTFRMFWKIDNFLNRANSYVPGYIMPGIIFRWGFSWNILG